MSLFFPPGPSQPVIAGGERDPAGAPGLPGPFSAPLGWPRLLGGERKSLPARKTAPRASERQCGHVFGGFPPAPRPFEDLRMPSEVQSPSGGASLGWEKAAGGDRGAVPPFCPERPAGPFSLPGGSQLVCAGGKGQHRGFLWPSWAYPGGISALRRRGHASFPVFPPSAGVGAAPLFALRGPQGRFSPRGGSQEVSRGEGPAHGLPVAARGMSRRFPGLRLGPFFPALPPPPIF